MRIAVVGAGAVGGYFGARLAQGGAELVVIARGAHLDAIRREGLRVTSVAGDAVVHPVECADVPAVLPPADVVLLGVKAWQVAGAAGTLGPLIGPDSCVLPLQNGVEAPAQIDRALGPGRALGGLCRILSEVVAPGVIKHSGVEPYVAFGELTGVASERCRRLLAAFEAAPGGRAELVPDIRVAMWRKFLLITAWGAVGASCSATIGQILERPELRLRLLGAMGEILAAAQAQGYRSRGTMFGMPCRSWRRRRPTELPPCNGTWPPAGHRSWMLRSVRWCVSGERWACRCPTTPLS